MAREQRVRQSLQLLQQRGLPLSAPGCREWLGPRWPGAPVDRGGAGAAIHGVFLDRLRYGSIRSSRDCDPDATLMAICERHGVNPADRREVLSFFQALINLL